MNYILYIEKDCPTCSVVVDYLREEKLRCQIVDVNCDKHDECVTIIPALFSNHKLLAYGKDIIKVLKST